MDEVVLKKKWVGFFFFLLKRKDQFYIFFRDHFINLLHIRNQTHMYVSKYRKWKVYILIAKCLFVNGSSVYYRQCERVKQDSLDSL